MAVVICIMYQVLVLLDMYFVLLHLQEMDASTHVLYIHIHMCTCTVHTVTFHTTFHVHYILSQPLPHTKSGAKNYFVV